MASWSAPSPTGSSGPGSAGPRACRAGVERLRRFCGRLYGRFDRRADALVELCDSILATGDGAVSSPVPLSLAAVHRPGWGGLYAALSKGRFDGEGLKDLLAGAALHDEDAADPGLRRGRLALAQRS